MAPRTKRARKSGVFKVELETPRIVRAIPKALRTLRGELLDYREAFKEMPPILAAGIAQNIGTKGGAINERWKQSDEEYKDRKKKAGKGSKQFIFSGDVKNQVTAPRGGKVRIAKRTLTWGTKKLPYARALNFKKLAYWGLSDQIKVKIQNIMDKWSVRKLDRATQILDALDGK